MSTRKDADDCVNHNRSKHQKVLQAKASVDEINRIAELVVDEDYAGESFKLF